MSDLLKLPLISIVVTSFNYEKFILKTLESVINQSYKNIEIIVVDDASSDNSAEKIKEFAKNIDTIPFKLIEHETNKGQLASIQTGLEHVNGQFVSFVDSDDVLVKDYVKTLIKLHLSISVAVVSSQLIEIDENDEIHTAYSISSFQKEKCFEIKSLDELCNFETGRPDFKILNIKSAPFGGWHWSAMSANMFRKTSIDPILKYDTSEDWKICPDKFLLNFAHLIGGSALVYAPLVGYRRHNDNAGNSNKVCGCKRYNNDETTMINVQNNKKIRELTLNFIKKNKDFFIEKFGARGFNDMLKHIYLSYLKIDLKKVFSCLFVKK